MRLWFSPPKRGESTRAALKQRNGHLKREKALNRQLERYYKAAFKSLSFQLAQFEREIEKAQSQGIEVRGAFLDQRTRLNSLLLQIDEQLNLFGSNAASAANGVQKASIAAGASDAYSLLKKTSRELGISAEFDSLPVEALRAIAVSMEPGTPMHDWFARFGERAAAQVKQTVFSSVSEGVGAKELAKRIRADLGNSKVSAMVSARKLAIDGYREASRQTAMANSDVVTGWQWLCSHSIRTCAACLAMDGTLHTLLEKLISHLACRCTAIYEILGKIPERKTGSDWLAEQDAATKQTVLGKTKAALYETGEIQLGDLVKSGVSPVWGEWKAEKSLRNLMQEGKLTAEQVAEAANR